jgi:predicted secreted hydrolase
MRGTRRSRLAAAVLITVAACSGDPDGVTAPLVTDAAGDLPASVAEPSDAATGDADHGADNTSPCRPEKLGRIVLPDDDAVHDAPMEWWYWTGHLQDEDGRWYGFQVTFFLFGAGSMRASLANVALTDIAAGTFEHAAKFSFAPVKRPELGFDFALGPHSARGSGGSDVLHAEIGEARLDLTVEEEQPPVAHHEDGFTEYPGGGDTFYYSRPRMIAKGTLDVGGDKRALEGRAWFDHQWGDLGPATDRGWDWFAIGLDDGRDLMLFVLHPLADEDSPTLVGGTLRGAGCDVAELRPEEVKIASMGSWKSSVSGCTYPSGWSIRAGDLELKVTPVLEDQEIYVSNDPAKTYWEGAAVVSGEATGRAYVELTGYCAKP